MMAKRAQTCLATRASGSRAPGRKDSQSWELKLVKFVLFVRGRGEGGA